LAILEIRQFPDPVLREKAKPVEHVTDPQIQKLIDDMFDTLYAAPGLGLAAPQVGVSLRLFVYDMAGGKSKDPKRQAGPQEKGTLINPEIFLMEGTQSDDEGCLSVEDYRQVVKRANRVGIRGLNREGQEVRLEGEGLLARLFQHEMDHLDGMLYIDRISSLKRNIFLRKFRKRVKLGV